jgi:hypothetical protein
MRIKGEEGLADAVEKLRAGFSFDQSGAVRAEGRGCDEWDDETFSFGEDAVEVFEMHGDECGFWVMFREGMNAIFKLGDVAVGAASAFRENDEICAKIHGIRHLADGVVIP